MKTFECQHCGQLVYFENVRCERCGHRLGYLPERATVSALVADGGCMWRPLATPGVTRTPCANAADAACNWLTSPGANGPYCTACRLNRTVPDMGDPENRLRWKRLETAKRRLVYGLMRLGLPIPNKADDAEHGLAFDFLADTDGDGDGGRILTGHTDGLITINIREADDAERERMRTAMGEPYRTLLGHFRHETGHYYWDRLIRRSAMAGPFRALFGDERADYAEALQRHYQRGPSDDWRAAHVSSYASSHPWEDFAETFAHYLHIVDALETAHAFDLRVAPRAGSDGLAAAVRRDPYRMADMDDLLALWLPITYAINSLNRSMGQPDLYPFVLSPPAVEKLRFVHEVIRSSAADPV